MPFYHLLVIPWFYCYPTFHGTEYWCAIEKLIDHINQIAYGISDLWKPKPVQFQTHFIGLYPHWS